MPGVVLGKEIRGEARPNGTQRLIIDLPVEERIVEGTVPSRGQPKADPLKLLCSVTEGLHLTAELPPCREVAVDVGTVGSNLLLTFSLEPHFPHL